MSISTDAIIFYGLIVDDMEAEELNLAQYDLSPYDDEVGLQIHCSYDDPMYIIGMVYERAWRGGPVGLIPENMIAWEETHGEDIKLHILDCATKMGLKIEGDFNPMFIIAPLWG